MKIFAIVLLVLVLGSFAFSAHALEPLVQCGTTQFTKDCDLCDLLQLLKRIIDFAAFTLAPILAGLLILLGGFLIILGGAQPEMVSTGKGMLTKTVIGLVIIYVSWLAANTVIQIVAGDNNTATSWFDLDCTPPEFAVIPTPSVTPRAGTSGAPLPPSGTVGAGKMSDKDARDRLISESGGEISVEPGASLQNINESTVDAIIKLQKDCGCAVRVTQGTGGTHDENPNNPKRHNNGYKIDLGSKNSDGSPNGLTKYITGTPEVFEKISDSPTQGFARYRDSSGNVYMLEDPGTPNEHWDVAV